MPVRHQRDLTNEGCYNGAAQSKVTLPQFRELICGHCRNPECIHAKWGMTPFDVRVQTWHERLFGEDREVSDLTLPKHLMIHETDFPDASHKALKLIVSAQRGDWEHIPDEGVSKSTPSTTSKVDEAVKRLAEKRGQKPPVPPSPEEQLAKEAEEAERLMLEEAAREPEPEPDPEPEPEPDPEPDPEQWTEQELRRARKLDQEAGVNTRPPPSFPGNTPMPAAGIMLDSRTPSPAKPEEDDPWAPKSEKVVAPGSKIKLGKGGDDG